MRYERAGLTSYAGLEFVRRWLRRDGLLALLRRELATTLPASDYGVLGLVLVVLALLLSGGRRLATCATSTTIRSCCASAGCASSRRPARSAAG